MDVHRTAAPMTGKAVLVFNVFTTGHRRWISSARESSFLTKS
jgi:hypothetical protein